jgi:hypothetical protein
VLSLSSNSFFSSFLMKLFTSKVSDTRKLGAGWLVQ